MEDRLQKLLRDKSMSSSELAKKIGVQPSTISHLLSGRNKPGFDFIYSLLNAFPDVNATWLITGQGPMYIREMQAQSPGAAGQAEADLFRQASQQESVRQAVQQPQPQPSRPVQPERKALRIVIYYDDHSWEEFLPG